MFRTVCLCLLLFFASATKAHPYGVLAHEAVIDSAWDAAIVPILRAKFHPTADQLRQARAYAYGGALIQDIGYYPLSSRLFGDLTHYVRSGDFVVALLRNAANVDEYAFALGALAHYVGDNYGHPLAINRSVPLIYPKLGVKYGDEVTYEQNPGAHLKTEFAFDVVQVARGAYAHTKYHSFIGFKVSKPVMERAFRATYGLDLTDVFADLDRAIGTFRYSVSTLVPQMTKVAWQTKRSEVEQLIPTATPKTFLYGFSRASYEQEFGGNYDHPGIRSKLLSVVLRIVPKVGPFAGLAFKVPTPEAEALFLTSFAVAGEKYRQLVQATANPRFQLDDTNFDTGKSQTPGAYERADVAYEVLLEKLEHRRFETVSPALRADLLSYFSARTIQPTPHDRKRWAKVQAQLDELRTSATN
jgi:Zinc dependent phospholipase C